MRLFKPDVDKLRARNDVEGLIKALDDTSAEVRIKAAYARGSDGTLSHLWFSAGWHAWESLGGQLASGTGPNGQLMGPRSSRRLYNRYGHRPASSMV